MLQNKTIILDLTVITLNLKSYLINTYLSILSQRRQKNEINFYNFLLDIGSMGGLQIVACWFHTE